MNFFMNPQRAGLGEFSIAYITDKWFRSGVNGIDMQFHIIIGHKTFFTIRAAVRSFPNVPSQVFQVIGSLYKRFIANIAGKWPFAGMQFHVIFVV